MDLDESSNASSKSIKDESEVSGELEDLDALLDHHEFTFSSIAIKCDPPEPEFSSEDASDAVDAMEHERERWLDYAAEIICAEDRPETAQAYFRSAKEHGLLIELNRAVLIRDILTSPEQVQQQLARYIVFMTLILDRSRYANPIHEGGHWDILQALGFWLKIVGPQRMKRDEIQTTYLFRILLEVAGGKVHVQQDEYFPEYTTTQNNDLFARTLGIIRTDLFEDLIPKGICTLILEFGVGQVGYFGEYLSHINWLFPFLQEQKKETMVLLMWSATLMNNESKPQCQVNTVHEWADSEEGWTLYKGLCEDIQDSRSVEEFSLILMAISSYWRLHPDGSDHCARPTNGSFLADLDLSLRNSGRLGKSGRFAEQMMHTLLRKLYASTSDYGKVIGVLQPAIYREYSRADIFDGLTDGYLTQRMNNCSHTSALRKLMAIKMLESRKSSEFKHLCIFRGDLLRDSIFKAIDAYL
ncbi:MAG: hypothetical protein Q9165_007976 [Trypethelium subeluteriae]